MVSSSLANHDSPSRPPSRTQSHNADLVSPALMLLSASLLFNASSHFLPRTLAACRIMLLANIGYHIWMVLLLIDLPSDDDFFSDQTTAVNPPWGM